MCQCNIFSKKEQSKVHVVKKHKTCGMMLSSAIDTLLYNISHMRNFKLIWLDNNELFLGTTVVHTVVIARHCMTLHRPA